MSVDKPGLETEGFRLGTGVFVFSKLIAPAVHQAVVFMFMHGRITGQRFKMKELRKWGPDNPVSAFEDLKREVNVIETMWISS